jgi:hypothetical protein
MQQTSFHQWIDNITMDLQGMRRWRWRWRWSDVIKQTTNKSLLPISTNMGDAGCGWLRVELKGLAFLSLFARDGR